MATDLAPADAQAATRTAFLRRMQVSIESEITNGLRNERDRLDHAKKNVDFYNGDFAQYPVRPSATAYDAARYERKTLLMNRVVKTLTANLYKDGPARILPDHPQAQEWLEAVYRDNSVDALWQEADRFATVGDVAAFEVKQSSDPNRPITIELWDSAHFCVWLDPDNARRPIAVATIDFYDQRRRLRLWTDLEVVTFYTEKVMDGQTSGGAAYKLGGRSENPYGIIPFSFVHFEFPGCYFWSGGPGDNIRDTNDYVNFFLTEHSDCIRYNTRPVIVLKNVQAGWRPPSPIRPGDVWDLPGNSDAAGTGEDPDASYLQADVSFVGAGWDDLQSYLDHSLEMYGVPPGTIRMSPTSTQSGVALVAEQIPLILWAKSRQRPFAHYEASLAKLVLTIGASHLGNQDDAAYQATSAQLAVAALDPGLVVRWPEMFPDLPGPDRDLADGWLLENRMTSRTHILMRRGSMTREEARAHLEEIAEDLEAEQELFSKIDQAALEMQQAAMGQGKPEEDALETDNEESQSQPADDEDEPE